MDAKTQIQIFKQQAVRWINTQIDELLGDGLNAKLIKPILEEMIDKYSQDKAIDTFLLLFVNDKGEFSIDRLLDRYIDTFTSDGGIRFQWRDIAPVGAILDKINGDKINVITAADIKNLKDNFTTALNK